MLGIYLGLRAEVENMRSSNKEDLTYKRKSGKKNCILMLVTGILKIKMK